MYHQSSYMGGKCMLMGYFNFGDNNWYKPKTMDDSHPVLKCVYDN